MRPDSLKFLLSWTNHRPAKRKISKPLVYDQVSSLGSPFALYDPVTVINPDAPKVYWPECFSELAQGPTVSNSR